MTPAAGLQPDARRWAAARGGDSEVSTPPLAIDLYCGLGGWTEGLLAEGYRVVGFDNECHVYGEARYQAQLVLQDVLTGRRSGVRMRRNNVAGLSGLQGIGAMSLVDLLGLSGVGAQRRARDVGPTSWAGYRR